MLKANVAKMKYRYFNSYKFVFSEIFLEVKHLFKCDKIRKNSITPKQYIKISFDDWGNIIPTKFFIVWKIYI